MERNKLFQLSFFDEAKPATVTMTSEGVLP